MKGTGRKSIISAAAAAEFYDERLNNTREFKQINKSRIWNSDLVRVPLGRNQWWRRHCTCFDYVLPESSAWTSLSSNDVAFWDLAMSQTRLSQVQHYWNHAKFFQDESKLCQAWAVVLWLPVGALFGHISRRLKVAFCSFGRPGTAFSIIKSCIGSTELTRAA
jgi:hypothetical protein